MLAFRKLDGEFLDEGGNILVGDDLAFQLFHAQGAFRNGNLDVVLYLHLASQTPAFLDLLAGEETRFRGKDGAAAFQHLQFALAAVGLAAAGGGKEDAVVCQRMHDVAAGSYFQLFGAVIDVDLDGTGRGEGALDPKEEGHQNQGHYCNDDDGVDNCITHNAFLLQCYAHEGHEGDTHQTHGDKGDTQALESGRNVGVAHLLADGSQGNDGQEPAKAGTQGVHRGLANVQEVFLLHEQGTAQNGAVHGNQRQEDTQRGIEFGRELLHHHFHNLHNSGDDGNEDDEAEEAQVHPFDEGIGCEHVGIEEIVDRKRNQEHEDDCEAQAGSGLHVFRYRQERAHSQEVSENHVVHKDGLYE